MPAEIESHASVREVPWHGVGPVLADYVDGRTLQIEASMDWTVEQHYTLVGPSIIRDAEGVKAYDLTDMADVAGTMPDLFVTMRHREENSPNPPFDFSSAFLGQTKTRWRAWQISDLIDFGSTLLKESSEEIKWETMGSLNGGRQVFASLTLPGDITILGTDAITRYITLATSFDGSLPNIVMRNNTRVVCANTLNMAMSEAPSIIKIRHSESMRDKMEEARRVLGVSTTYDKEFAETLNRLAEIEHSREDFEKLVDSLFPIPSGVERMSDDDKARDKRMGLVGNFLTTTTLDDSIRNTRYGGLNAVTEWGQHLQRRSDTKRDMDERKTESLFFGKDRDLTERAFEFLTADLDDISNSPNVGGKRRKGRAKQTLTVAS